MHVITLETAIAQSLQLLFSISPSDDIQKSLNIQATILNNVFLVERLYCAITSSFTASGVCAGLVVRLVLEVEVALELTEKQLARQNPSKLE